jgi:methylated-DNA-[protein]-cysteine S-methyltransferase
MDELKRLVGRKEAERRAADGVSTFTDAAVSEGLVDVAIGATDSPIGRLTVAVTPRGLARVLFESEDADRALEDLARAISPRVLWAPSVTDEARRELDEYFEGARRRFDLRLDRRMMTPFARDVLGATARVGYGRVSTYGQIAARIGRPRASRAVGAALGSNPIPIVVPCHRVVGAGGRLTGYAGGLDRKEALLRLEGSLGLW